MSGFAPDWLALREPADHAAINHVVRRELLHHLNTKQRVRIVDLGCGTGSNFRSLSPEIDQPQNWLLVDHDPVLLEIAREQTSNVAHAHEVAVETREADLSTGDIASLLNSADLVTAAALFDLISKPVIERMVSAIADANIAFATTLTYDGIAAWQPADPLDNTMREAFNTHQQGDKGFGPAAGPNATNALASAFEGHGYRIIRGKSPWILDASSIELRDATDTGWADAVNETGKLSSPKMKEWLASRLGSTNAITIVSHEDIIALPPQSV